MLLTLLCILVAPVVAQENNNDRTAFFKALERRDVKSTELFLSKGINVNIVNDKGDTPLTLASRRGYFEIAKLLVSKGARVDLRNRKGESALMLAASGNCREIMIFLLQSGADINKKDYLGRTALWYAKNCMIDCRASEKILLANGATVDAGEMGKQVPCDRLPSD